MVATMSTQQLTDMVAHLKTLSTSAPTLEAKLSADSEKIKVKRKPSSPDALLRKSILDTI